MSALVVFVASRWISSRAAATEIPAMLRCLATILMLMAICSGVDMLANVGVRFANHASGDRQIASTTYRCSRRLDRRASRAAHSVARRPRSCRRE